MLNKKNTLAAIILISVLGINTLSSVSASDFDCSSIDRETMKEIMDKQNNGTALSTSESELLENAKTCKSQGRSKMRGERGDQIEMGDEQKDNRDEMKNIIEKQKNGETLTDDEQEKYDKLIENKPTKSSKPKREVKNLSTKAKKTIGSTVVKFTKNYENLSDEGKISKYEKLQEKLESALDKIQDSSKYSNAKKELFENIINELLNQLDDKIDEIS